jgi:hypothetical protein
MFIYYLDIINQGDECIRKKLEHQLKCDVGVGSVGEE